MWQLSPVRWNFACAVGRRVVPRGVLNDRAAGRENPQIRRHVDVGKRRAAGLEEALLIPLWDVVVVSRDRHRSDSLDMPLAKSKPQPVSRLSGYPEILLQSAEVDVTKRDSKSVTYENRTKSAKCGGLETNGPRERISVLTGSTQCGGLRAKVMVIGDFSAANLGGESWSQKDWRRGRDTNCRYRTASERTTT